MRIEFNGYDMGLFQDLAEFPDLCRYILRLAGKDTRYVPVNAEITFNGKTHPVLRCGLPCSTVPKTARELSKIDHEMPMDNLYIKADVMENKLEIIIEDEKYVS